MGKVVAAPEGGHLGQCVSFVRSAVRGLPHSSEWKPGDAVRGNTAVKPGTPIATFQDGKYANSTKGESHAAVYMSQDQGGLYVIDQWVKQPVHARYVRFKGSGKPINDGDAYSVVVAGSVLAGDVYSPTTVAGDADVVARMHAAMAENARGNVPEAKSNLVWWVLGGTAGAGALAVLAGLAMRRR